MSVNKQEASKQYVQWQENDTEHQAFWLSQSSYAPPSRIVIVDDTTTADEAYRLANAGTSMLWRGDFHNAKQLLQALERRIKRSEQRKANKKSKSPTKQDASQTIDEASKDLPFLFHQQRQAQSQRVRLLSRLLLQLDITNDRYICKLRRAPDVSEACEMAFGKLCDDKLGNKKTSNKNTDSIVLSFRDLQGALSAMQWHKKGVPIDGLDLSIYPHYGVFAPTRQEYVKLVLDAPLPQVYDVAYDIGTGTGLLAIVLARRGVKQVIATDFHARALACAQDNVSRLELDNIGLQQTDLYPTNAPKANLIVCNPPWLPAKASSPLDYAVYDANSTMLRGFLTDAKRHLAENGEVWLILSDLAEHLNLRSREALLDWIDAAGLTVKYRLDTEPEHSRSFDEADPLYMARSREVTSLWCLV